MFNANAHASAKPRWQVAGHAEHANDPPVPPKAVTAAVVTGGGMFQKENYSWKWWWGCGKRGNQRWQR